MSSVVTWYARLGLITALALGAAPLSAQDAGDAAEPGGKTVGSATETTTAEPAQDEEPAQEEPTQQDRQQLAPRVEELSQRVGQPPNDGENPKARRGTETRASVTATEEKPLPLKTVAVLGLRATGTNIEVANRARALLTTEIDAEERWRSLSGDALQTALDAVPATEKAALHCDQPERCVGAIAKATGANYVVFGAVSANGASIVVTLSAFGRDKGAVVATETAQLPAEGGSSTDASTAEPSTNARTSPTAPSSTAPSTAPSSTTKQALAEGTHRLVQAMLAAEQLRNQAGAGQAVASKANGASATGAPEQAAVDAGARTPGEATAEAGAESRSIVPMVVVASTGGTVFAGSVAMYGGLALTLAGSIPLVLGSIANAQVAMLEQEALSSSDGIASADNLSAAAALQANIGANEQAWNGWGQYLLYAGLAATAVGTVAAAVGTTWALTSGLLADEPPGEDATIAGLPADGPPVGAPGTDAPRAGEPTSSEPTSGKPTPGDAPAGDPAAAEPTTREPAVGKPAANEPAASDPSSAAPAIDKPVTTEPATDAPATDDPVRNEPATGEPGTNEPATDAPATEEVPGDEGAAGDASGEQAPGDRSSREGATK